MKSIDFAQLLVEFLRFAVPVGLSLYVFLSSRSRADRKAQDAEFKKMQMDNANQDVRLTGFQLEIERIAEDFHQRHRAHESKLDEVGRMREDMAVIKARQEISGETIKQMSDKMDRLFDLVTTLLHKPH